MTFYRAIHPEKILIGELNELGITPTAFARQIDAPPNRISQIIAGERAVTGDTALTLGHWFDVEPQIWLNLQTQCDFATAERRTGVAVRNHPTVAHSVDVAAVTAELKTHSKEKIPLVFDVEQFDSCDSHPHKTKKGLGELLELAVYRQAIWLQRTDKSLRDQLTQYGTLVGAAENVRMQGKISCLTWVLLLLTVATLAANVLAFFVRSGIFRLPWF